MRFTFCTIVALLILACPVARADSCPSAYQVHSRKISRDYEWTVDEGVTLKEILSVTRLRAVAVQNAGEFIICGYDRGKGKNLNLYAKPKGKLCVVTRAGGKWNKSDAGDLSCGENDPEKCRFQFNCAAPSGSPPKKQ